MTKQVALSDEAYAELRREKKPEESFSQAVLRLLRSARLARKDPMAFVGQPRRFTMTMQEHLDMVESDRDRDLAD